MFYTHSHLNRPFAQYDHMVLYKICHAGWQIAHWDFLHKATTLTQAYNITLFWIFQCAVCHFIVLCKGSITLQCIFNVFSVKTITCQSIKTYNTVIPEIIVVWVKGWMIGERTYFWASSGYCLNISFMIAEAALANNFPTPLLSPRNNCNTC